MQKKPLSKFSTHLWLKLFKKMGIEGTYFNIVKAIYGKSTANIILNGEKLKAFPLRSGTRQVCPRSPTLFNIVLKILAIAIREEKEIKRNPDQKRSKALTVCRWMILYIENLKDIIRKLLELISEFSKVAGYKLSSQKCKYSCISIY